MRAKEVVVLLLFLSFLSASAGSQSGGSFDLSHSVIASGGGNSAGQTFRIEGTIGQGIAGTLSTGPNGSGGQFGLRGGFWSFEPAAPTAASVSVSGSVVRNGGIPVPRAVVTLADGSGTLRFAVTNPFGHFRFDAVEIGQTYIVEVRSRRYQFVPRAIFLTDELTSLEITAIE